MGTLVASVGAGTLMYTDGSTFSPLTETTTYTYQVSAYSSAGESGPSNANTATTETEPAPRSLSSITFTRGLYRIVELHWTNNSADDDSYYLEGCGGQNCTNFIQFAKLNANTTSYIEGVPYYGPPRTLRYRVRTHSLGGYSDYSNIRTQIVP